MLVGTTKRNPFLMFELCFYLSPGRKNNLTLQRSAQKYNVKVSYMGSLIGKRINLLYHIPCFYSMRTHACQFLVPSKYMK